MLVDGRTQFLSNRTNKFTSIITRNGFLLFQELNKKYFMSKIVNLILVFALLLVTGCLSKKHKENEIKEPPAVVVTPTPPTTPRKPAFICESKKDYEDYKCAGKFQAKSKVQLDDYLKNYGLEKNKYKDLEIAYELTGEDLQIHSPCSITIKRKTSISVTNLCLDGRNGVGDQSDDDREEKASLTIEKFLGIVSEQGKVRLDGKIKVSARDLHIVSFGGFSIGEDAQIILQGDAILETSSLGELKPKILFSANNLNILSDKKLAIGEGSRLHIVNQTNLESQKCEIHKSVVIDSQIKTGSCLGKTNSSPVMVGNQQFIGKKTSAVALILNGATDVDGGAITYEMVDLPSSGVISGCLGNSIDLSCIYTPDASNTPASVSFSYRARDGFSMSKTVSTVKIILNETPVMVGDQAYTTLEDYPIKLNLSGATDTDGDLLTYYLLSPPSSGALSNCLGNTANLSCLYTPSKNFVGTVRFSYAAFDGYGVASKSAQVTITISAVNDPPMMISNQTENFNEDSLYQFRLKGAIDAEGSPLNYSVVLSPNAGVLTECAQGNEELLCNYQPQKDFNGTATFTYKASDGNLESLSVSTVTLNVIPVNDAPVVGEDNFIQGYVDSRVIFEVNKSTDIDSSILHYSIVDAPTNGSLVNCFSLANKRSCEYLPNPGFLGADSFTYRVFDGELNSAIAKVILSIDKKILPTKVIQLASGEYHTCALLNSGQVRCWGSNEFGQLGHENIIPVGNKASPYSFIFQAGSVDLGGFAIEIAAGKNHTCALLDTGKVRCWGANQQGQAGYSIFTNLGDDVGETPALLGDVPLDGHVIYISTGYYNTCALLMNGEVRCWGSFGTGTTGYVNPANSRNLEIDGNVKTLATGFKHTCVLLENGAVKCWSGDGTLAEGPLLGELGYNHKHDVGAKDAPDVFIGGKVIQLSSKRNHNCALLENKKVRCWGANFMGQLGLGITANVGDGIGPSINQIGNVRINEDVKHIDVGVYHSCAVLETGGVRCWGRGLEGQLGYGGDDEKIGDNEFPSTISTVDLGGKAVATSLSLYASCALLESGQVRCWGLGADGRGTLGYGNDENIGVNVTPAQAGDLALFDPLSISINAGFSKKTRALDLLQLNSVITFQNNVDAPKIIWDKVYGPSGVVFENPNSLDSKIRFSVAGEYLLRVRAITEGKVVHDTVKITVSKNFLNPVSVGEGHSCFINISGSLECMGDNILPGPVVGIPTIVPELSEVVEFNSRKSIHCAVVIQGLVKCWGQRFATGRANLANDYTYEKFPVLGITDAISVATGNATACALLRTGSVNCWGLYDASSYGTLGDGLGLDSTIPVRVFGITNAEKLVMGTHYGCVLLRDATVKCWGEATVPDLYLSFFPELVAGLQDIVDLSAGEFHVCAINGSGNLYCWGLLNNSGEQGSGNTKSTAPGYKIINVAGVGDAAQVVAGLDYTCYLKVDQTVRCFGNNQYGQLGNGTTTSSLYPVDVYGLQNIVRISGGAQNVCAFSQDQKIYCWGKNNKRQIENSNNFKITKPVRVFNTGGII